MADCQPDEHTAKARAEAISFQEVFAKMGQTPLWAKVRQLAIRGTVPDPSREPVGTAIPGLFRLIENGDSKAILEALVGAGLPDLATEVEMMLKGWEEISKPAGS